MLTEACRCAFFEVIRHTNNLSKFTPDSAGNDLTCYPLLIFWSLGRAVVIHL